MISVIIPAHDEAAVIGRCLHSILEGAEPGELEIIVVCNGCKDDTAAIARRFGGPVAVLETPVPSKSNALNLGDKAARGYPRLYIDADIVVSPGAIRRVADVLRDGTAMAAAPQMRVDLDGSGWLIRAYYRIWTRLPYCEDAMIGSGFYALSREGRCRFESFPNIISDDGYVRLLFGPAERATVQGCSFHVTPPRKLSDLVNIKTRSQFGKYQLAAAYPELLVNDPRSYRNSLKVLLRDVRLWPSIFVYCLVLVLARMRTCWRFLRRRETTWDRDESSRQSEVLSKAPSGQGVLR